MALTKISTGGVKDDAASQAKIADEAVDEARLQISNAGTNGQFLQKQSGNTGGLTWADAITSIADDSITQAKIANDAIGQDQLADNAVVLANLTNDCVTGDKIADEAIAESRLEISNAGTNGQFLQKQSGNTGGLTWATVQSAPTITGTMSGSVAQDKPVQVKSDGTLEAVVQTSAGVGTTGFIDNGETSGDTWDQTCRTAPLGGGKFATIWINSDHYAECCITEVNPTTHAVSKGSTTVLNTVDVTNFPSVCYDHVNSRIVYSYMVSDVSGQGPTLYGRVATVSGTTQTFGTQVSIAADSYHADSCFDPENSTVVWAWEYNNDIYCNTAVTTSSRSLTKGTTSQSVTGDNVGGGQQPTIKSIRLEGCVGKVGIAFRWQQDIWYRPMLVGNNSVAQISGYGEVELMTTSGDTDVGLGYARSHWIKKSDGSVNTTGNVGIVTAMTDAGVLHSRTFILNSWGAAATLYGSTATLTTGSVTQFHGCKHPPFDINLGKWIYVSKYSPASGSDYLAWQGLAPDLTQGWTPTITTPTQIDDTTDAQEVCLAHTQIEGTNNTGTFIDPISTDDRMYSVWRDNADSDKINHAAFLTTNVTNLNTKVIGFADAAYTNGQTATIKVNSNTTTQSSLTPGTEYYVQGDGSIGTSAHSQATVKAGIALTSTKLLIRQQ